MSLDTIRAAHLPDLAGKRVLDLGCGEGRHALSTWLTQRAIVVGIDMSEADLATARSRQGDFPLAEDDGRALHFLKADGLRLPFDDASFDVVICSEVLEHIPDYQAMLREANRVLIDGGTLAVSVPRYWTEWICWRLSRGYRETPGGHIRIFRNATLRHAVESLGFRRYARHWAHALHSPYWWLRCLFWSSADDNPLVRAYHRMLVWDLMQQPKLTRGLERLLDPLLGKSIAMYFVKMASRSASAPNAGLSVQTPSTEATSHAA